MKMLGFCYHCQQWCDLGKNSWLPDHNLSSGEKCRLSRYSHSGLKYKLENEAEARAMAQTIMNDKGYCLQSGGMHSMGCSDGDQCASERLRRAKALADYILTTNKKE